MVSVSDVRFPVRPSEIRALVLNRRLPLNLPIVTLNSSSVPWRCLLIEDLPLKRNVLPEGFICGAEETLSVVKNSWARPDTVRRIRGRALAQRA